MAGQELLHKLSFDPYKKDTLCNLLHEAALLFYRPEQKEFTLNANAVFDSALGEMELCLRQDVAVYEKVHVPHFGITASLTIGQIPELFCSELVQAYGAKGNFEFSLWKKNEP